MTPKEKAEELHKKFAKVGLQQREEGIECALICAKECLDQCAYADHKIKHQWLETYDEPDHKFISWWDEVIEEIKKL